MVAKSNIANFSDNIMATPLLYLSISSDPNNNINIITITPIIETINRPISLKRICILNVEGDFHISFIGFINHTVISHIVAIEAAMRIIPDIFNNVCIILPPFIHL